MKKILTITFDTSNWSMETEWGDGVMPEDVIIMCGYAESEAQYEIDTAGIDDFDKELKSN